MMGIIFVVYSYLINISFAEIQTELTMRTVKERIDFISNFSQQTDIELNAAERIDSKPGVLGLLADREGNVLSKRNYGANEEYGWSPFDSADIKLKILHNATGDIVVPYKNTTIELYWQHIEPDRILVGGVVEGVNLDTTRDAIIAGAVATGGVLLALLPMITNTVKNLFRKEGAE